MSSPKETRLRLALADAALAVYLGVTRTPPISEDDLLRRIQAERAAAKELVKATEEMDRRTAPRGLPARKAFNPTCNRCGNKVPSYRATCRACIAAAPGGKTQ